MDRITSQRTGRAQILLLCLERGIEGGGGRDPILPRSHIELPDHAICKCSEA